MFFFHFFLTYHNDDNRRTPATSQNPCLTLFLETRLKEDTSLCLQARPLFKDRRKFPQMADPLLQGQYPVRGLYQALAIAAMCVQEQPNMRPLIADVVTALNYLASQTYDPEIHPVQSHHHGSNSPAARRGSEKKCNEKRSSGEMPLRNAERGEIKD